MKQPSMSFLAVGLMFLIVAVLSVAAQSTTQNLFVEIDGSVQGGIGGGSQYSGYEGQIVAVEYHHQMNFDSKGLLRHKEVIWTKRADSASVNLWTAFRDGELLNLVIFHHHHVAAPGQGELMTVTLTGARILAIETYHPENNSLELHERLRMNYQKLRVDQQGQNHEITDPSN